MSRAFLSGVALFFCASIGSANEAQTTTYQKMSLPAGTYIRVRTIDVIDVSSVQPGARLRGSLADPVTTSDGRVVFSRGAPVQLSAVNVKKAGHIKGRDRIDLKVDSITLHGKSYPVVSTIAESVGDRQGNRTLRGAGIGAGAGAVIGGIAGGGKGLAIGSLLGGGAGTAVAAGTGNKPLSIPPETVLTFRLQSTLKVK